MGVDETGGDKTPGRIDSCSTMWRRAGTNCGDEPIIDRKPTIRQFLTLLVTGGEESGRVNDEVV